MKVNTVKFIKKGEKLEMCIDKKSLNVDIDTDINQVLEDEKVTEINSLNVVATGHIFDILSNIDLTTLHPVKIVFKCDYLEKQECEKILKKLHTYRYGLLSRNPTHISMQYDKSGNPLLNRSFAWRHDHNPQQSWEENQGQINGSLTFGSDGKLLTNWGGKFGGPGYKIEGRYHFLSRFVVQAVWYSIVHILVFDSTYTSFLSVRMNDKYKNRISGGILVKTLPKTYTHSQVNKGNRYGWTKN